MLVGLIFPFFALFFLLSVVLLIIALFAKRPKQKKDFFPPVSVISWAWKDGNIIGRKIKNFLSLNYPGKFEVIIVDNASKDETQKVCRGFLKDGKLKCYRAPKQYDRKAFALDKAIRETAKYDIIAMTDPDGICNKNWLKTIVQPFKDEKVGAVIGLTHCGNFYKNFFTRLRAVEDEWFYVISPLGRSFGKDVHLVCGANYAVRRQALKSVGFHGKKTLAEDFELTIKLYSKGWKVKVTDANVWQEEVENLGQYFRQRLRWSDSSIKSTGLYKKDILKIFKKRPLGLFLFFVSYQVHYLSFFSMLIMLLGLISNLTVFLFGLIIFAFLNFAISIGLIKFNKKHIVPYVPLYLLTEALLIISIQVMLFVLRLVKKRITWRSLFNGYYHSGAKIVMK